MTAPAVLTINSHNYGAWSMRAWLMCRIAGLDFDVRMAAADDPATRAELLQLSPSFLVPSLESDGLLVWDTLAIAEFLHEACPTSGLLPADPAARARSRSISGELHSGFPNLRSALPMNISQRLTDFRPWSGVAPDIERITSIWRDCLAGSDGPWLFGRRPSMADAMFAPECSRFVTYGVDLDPVSAGYVRTVWEWPAVREWVAAAEAEPDLLMELQGEF